MASERGRAQTGPACWIGVEQLLRDVDWGDLDVLVVDLPPGTGDAQLTLAQKAHLHGAIIVTTPQDVALADAIKGISMFRKVGVPVLGVVENMSYFLCAHCGERTEIFGHGGGKREAERLGAPFLGEIPLDPGIRAGGDAAVPAAAPESGSPAREIFLALADRIREALSPGAEPEARGALDWLRNAWKGGDSGVVVMISRHSGECHAGGGLPTSASRWQCSPGRSRWQCRRSLCPACLRPWASVP